MKTPQVADRAITGGRAAVARGPYRLVPGPATVAVPPVLDARQSAVAAHRGGPLLVLAGPGTGKTTTLVETVVGLLDDPERPLSPEQVLVLTFSRRAAAELRHRITARRGRSTGVSMAWTFHAFCHALVTEERQGRDDGPLCLLTGPEQDVMVRELLTGSAEGVGQVHWPQAMSAALGTRGLADEVRAVMARARELGLDPEDLATLAWRSGRDSWAAVADFMADYLDVLDARGALDYAEVVHRAVLLAESPDSGARTRWAAIVVDEYQDTDRAQERLLQALAGGGRYLVAFGDPDQSIYAFRGADVSAILEFPDRFAARDGSPARVLTLQTSRRAGPALLAASRAVTRRMTIRSLPQGRVAEHRALRPVDDPPGEPAHGSVTVRLHPTVGAELADIAEHLRRAHLQDGVEWSHMAVLVRSARRSIPLLRRVLGAAGVPVVVAGDEMPLAREPAVVPLLVGLRALASAGQRAGGATDHGEWLSEETAASLLDSGLADVEPSVLRSLARALRHQDRQNRDRLDVSASMVDAEARHTADDPNGTGESASMGTVDVPGPAAGSSAAEHRSSATVLRDALIDPSCLAPIDPRLGHGVRELGELLLRLRAALAAGGDAQDVLWELWRSTSWPARLRRASDAGGAAGRAADRDLDAVCTLFDLVGRGVARRGAAGARALLDELEAQEIPAGSQQEQGVQADGVRLLTAHRAKGLEWDVVVVAGVQEGVWPDLRRRGSLLEPDRLGHGELVEPPGAAELLAEERRLFYVAVTRARRRLLVTAVDSAEDDGERPSRFLDELDVDISPVRRAPLRSLTLPALVAELRRTALSPSTSPALRAAAVERLAGLCAARDDAGHPLAPSADPGTWWGLRDVTGGAATSVAADQPVVLSPSAISSLATCPLRWFLSHEVKGDVALTPAAAFGKVVHALADAVTSKSLAPDRELLRARIDDVWAALPFDAPWQSQQQRLQAYAAVERFLSFDQSASARGRVAVASEVTYDVALATSGGPVLLRGSADRLEVDGDGRLHVVDFKTTKTTPKIADVAVHPQLGAYQRAVMAGAFDAVAGGSRAPGGAELVLLRTPAGTRDAQSPKVARQPPLESDAAGVTWIDPVIAMAATHLRAGEFPAVLNEGCDRCTFRRACPARAEGSQVVT